MDKIANVQCKFPKFKRLAVTGAISSSSLIVMIDYIQTKNQILLSQQHIYAPTQVDRISLSLQHYRLSKFPILSLLRIYPRVLSALRAGANASARSARAATTSDINVGPGKVRAGTVTAENIVVVRIVVAAGGTGDVLKGDAADGAVAAWLAGGGAVLVVLLDVNGVAVEKVFVSMMYRIKEG